MLNYIIQFTNFYRKRLVLKVGNIGVKHLAPLTFLIVALNFCVIYADFMLSDRVFQRALPVGVGGALSMNRCFNF